MTNKARIIISIKKKNMYWHRMDVLSTLIQIETAAKLNNIQKYQHISYLMCVCCVFPIN